MDFHPIANIFPMLPDDELRELAEDIKANGLKEPIWVYQKKILDGRNRFKACQMAGKAPDVRVYSGDSPAAFVVSLNLKRRHLSASQKAAVAVEVLPWFEKEAKERQAVNARNVTATNKEKIPDSSKGQARDKAGKSLGVSGRYVEQAKKIKAKAPKIFEEVKSGKKNITQAKQEVQRQERDAKREAAARGVKLHDRIIVGDFRKKSDQVPDSSLSLIFTDPPYDKGSETLIADLGAFAADKLADGGSLICYVGHVQLPAVLVSLSKHLRFWWPCACVHSDSRALLREYGLRAGWKPILWFVKGTRHDKTQIIADTVSGGREKDHHDWQQAESEAAHFIEGLCPEDGIVCDPFLGGGTTAVAAARLGRKWIGFEIDPVAVAEASRRIGK